MLGLQLPQIRHFAPILLAWIFSLGVLAFENDFGTALLVFGLFVVMLYISTERISWILIGGILSAAGVWVIVQLRPHILARFRIWLHAFDQEVYDAKAGSYQIVQGWFGMASGGLTGTGLGKGYPTRAYAANSDMIIASLAEELGLVGAIAILLIYLLIVFRALKTGIHLRDGFGKLLAGGLGAVLAIQVFLIVGGITRVIPLTGLAMPFLALGGSALLSNWIIIGLLLRMSDAARRPVDLEDQPLSCFLPNNLPRSLAIQQKIMML
ncbi:FtsW/RodA/SpoVE family cell cycle protein [Arcanobacterium hippocoleae]